MKKTPLILRIPGCILLAALLVFALVQPMMTQGESAALVALAQQGKPYVLGTFGPETYDCSGLVKDAYAHFGVEMIHSAQITGYDEATRTVDDVRMLRPGDLIFFDTVSDKDKCDHVGLWLGNNRFVHASSSEMVVMVSEFDEKWRERYSWCKQILDPYGQEQMDSVYHLLRNKANELLAKEEV